MWFRPFFSFIYPLLFAETILTHNRGVIYFAMPKLIQKVLNWRLASASLILFFAFWGGWYSRY
jgi:hypothetical protein